MNIKMQKNLCAVSGVQCTFNRLSFYISYTIHTAQCLCVLYLSTVAVNDDGNDGGDGGDGGDVDAGSVGDIRFCVHTSLVNNCLA